MCKIEDPPLLINLISQPAASICFKIGGDKSGKGGAESFNVYINANNIKVTIQYVNYS